MLREQHGPDALALQVTIDGEGPQVDVRLVGVALAQGPQPSSQAHSGLRLKAGDDRRKAAPLGDVRPTSSMPSGIRAGNERVVAPDAERRVVAGRTEPRVHKAAMDLLPARGSGP